jgi:hypothetical protein
LDLVEVESSAGTSKFGSCAFSHASFLGSVSQLYKMPVSHTCTYSKSSNLESDDKEWTKQIVHAKGKICHLVGKFGIKHIFVISYTKQMMRLGFAIAVYLATQSFEEPTRIPKQNLQLFRR